MPTATSGASRRGEEPPDQRQTGLCSMQRPVILSSGLPPDLPDGFIRLPYRQPYLKLSPAGSHGSSLPPTLPTGFVSQTFRPPDRQTFPNARPTSLTGSLTGRFRSSGQTGQPHRQPDRQPHRPATPASPTDQPDQQPHRPSTPAINTGHPHPPSTPAKVPPAGLTGRLRSAGRRLRGWRSSRHG